MGFPSIRRIYGGISFNPHFQLCLFSKLVVLADRPGSVGRGEVEEMAAARGRFEEATPAPEKDVEETKVSVYVDCAGNDLMHVFTTGKLHGG